MIAELTNHLWQSTLFAVAAGLLTVAFRKNRAEVRYWLWFSASLKFFVPFALLINLGSHFSWAPATKAIAAPSITFAIEQVAEPLSDVSLPAPPTPNAVDWTPVITLILWGVWLFGFSTIVLVRLAGWRRIRSVLRASTPIEISSREIPAGVRARACSGLLDPGIVGWLRPILLLPADIMERLTQPQLDAILAHELCHVRRRDNLTSSIHMVVEAVFWFHPLVWWMSARLVEERERACDEEVLRLGNDPQVYAEGILNVCKAYMESPLRCVSGVTGANLKKRIQSILSDSVAIELNAGRKMALTIAAMAALAIPIAVGVMHASPVRLQEPQSLAPKPQFEVASVKPCTNSTGGRDGGPGRAGEPAGGSSPGRIYWNCRTVDTLIRMAYLLYANGQRNPTLSAMKTPIVGGPSWTKSEGYDVNAKADGTPRPELMQGPMLQALLEDRFNLMIHRETREIPVYVLTVAKGGPKLHLFEEGSCIHSQGVPASPGIGTGPISERANIPPLAPDQKRCHLSWGPRTGNGNQRMVDAQAVSLDGFAGALTMLLDRPVVDKTGIAGLFDYNFEYEPDENMVGFVRSDEPGGPSIFTAVQQLGLKLEPSKGPGEFLVIDRVEKPKENEELSPAAVGAKQTQSQSTGLLSQLSPPRGVPGQESWIGSWALNTTKSKLQDPNGKPTPGPVSQLMKLESNPGVPGQLKITQTINSGRPEEFISGDTFKRINDYSFEGTWKTGRSGRGDQAITLHFVISRDGQTLTLSSTRFGKVAPPGVGVFDRVR